MFILKFTTILFLTLFILSVFIFLPSEQTFGQVTPPSNNSNLSAITILPALLNELFSPSTFTYTANVSVSTHNVTVNPTTAHSGANTSITPSDASNATGHQVNLSIGNTQIDIMVTAQDGVTNQTYEILVTRAAPTLSIANASAQEADGNFVTFTLTLNETISQEVSVNYTTLQLQPASATENVDYNRTNGTLTIQPGQQTATIQVLVLDDGNYEGNETFGLNLTSPVNAIFPGNAQSIMATGKIEETPPEVSIINANATSVNENDGTANINVTVSFPQNSDVLPTDTNVTVTIDNGTATSGQDFNPVENFNVTIPSGQTNGSGSFSLQLIDDNVFENTETFLIRSGSLQLTIDINDNDAAPSSIELSLDRSNASEGDGSVTFNVSAGFSGNVVHTQDTNVTIKVANGTAVSGDDFGAVSDFNITIPAGSLNGSQTFSLNVVNDNVFEGPEILTINASAVATVNPSAINITIIDNDVKPSQIVLTSNLSSISESGGNATVNVSASFPGQVTLTENVDITVSILDGTAVSGDDFGAVSDFSITIPAGSLNGSGTFNLSVIEDNILETQQTLSVSGSVSGFTVQPASISIVDNDVFSYTFDTSLNSSSVSEGDGSVTLNVSVGFPGNVVLTTDTNVTISIENSTAFSGDDFDAVPDFNVIIPAGRLNNSVVFNLSVVDDNVAESQETLSLFSRAGSFTDSQVAISIADNDVAPSSVDLSLNVSSVSEGDGSVTFNVSVAFPGSVVLTTDTNVTVSVANGTAVSGDDFGVVSDFNVTIPAGNLTGSGNFSLSVVDDTIFEGSETLSVGGSSAGLTVNPSSVTVTIQDNDVKPTQIVLTSDPTSVNENSGATTINVSAAFSGSIALTEDINVTISVANGTAVSGDDFDVVSDFNVTIPAGNLTGSETFSLNVVNDLLAEGPETFSIGGSVSGFTVQSASLSIADNDVAPSSVDLSLNVSSVSEGDGSVTFNVSVAFPGSVVLTTDTDVTVSVANGTAVSGDDFGVVSDFNVTIPAGSLNGSGNFSLSVVDDSILEGSETLSVGGSAAGLTVNPSSVTVTIQDNDVRPNQIVLTSDPTSVNESGGATTVNVSAAFSGNVILTEDVNVTVSVANGTAVSGADFDAVSDFNVTIPAGSLNGSETFSLSVVDDTIFEGSEALSVGGSVSGFTVQSASLSIADNDVAPSSVDLSLNVSSVSEGDGSVTFNVSVAFPGSVVLTTDTDVTVSVANGTAVSGDDFGVVSDFNVTIPAGNLTGSGNFSLSVVDDTIFEGSETLSVGGSAAGLTVNPSSVTVTIQDNDVKPTQIVLTSDPTSVNENSGATTVNVSAAFSGSIALAEDVNVTISILDGTAASGDEFNSVSDFNVTIPAGNLTGSETFNLTVNDNNVLENDKALSISGTASSFTINAITLTINEDDTSPSSVDLSLNASSVSEGDGSVTFNVSVAFPGSVVLTTDTEVTVSVANGTAVSGDDFGVVSDFNVTIPAGSLNGSGTFSLSVVDDTIFEGSETLSVGGSATGLTVNPSSVTVTIQDNDAEPTQIILTSDPTSVNENSGATTVNVSASFPGSIALTEDVNVTVSVANGTAVSGADFDAVSDFNVTIPAGSLNGSETFSLSVVDDTIFEGSEALSVGGSVSGFTVQSASLSIADNDVAPSSVDLSLNVSSVSEGDGSVTFNVSVGFPGNVVLTTDTNVTVSVANGTAVSGDDFDVVSDFNVTIPAGNLTGSGNFSLSVVDDSIFEGSETLSVGGSSAGLTVNPSSVTVTIQDNDVKPTQIVLTSDPTSVNENSSATTVNVSAAFSGSIALTEDVNVTVSVANGTAVSGADFDAVSDFNVTIPAGNLSGSETFSLSVVDDSIFEGSEALSVGGSVSGFTVQSASLNIVDNDVASSSVDLSLDVSSVSEGDGSVTFNVSVGFPGNVVLTTDTNITVSVANGTAVSGDDFDVVSDFNVTIPAGSLNGSGTFSLSVVDDNIFEGSETLSVGGTAAGLTVNPSSVTVTIQDNDAEPTQIILTSDPTSVNENSGATTINVSASFPGTIALTENVTATISIANGTAVSGADFDVVSDFNVTIPAGSLNSSGTFSLSVVDDNISEGSEALSIGGSVSGFTVQSASLNIVDNDVASSSVDLSLDVSSVSEGDGSVTFNVSVGFPGNVVLTTDTGVTVSVANGTAVSGDDFGAVSDFNVTIPAGSLNGSGTFSLSVVDDSIFEGSETLSVGGSSDGLTVNPSSVTVTIQDNDAKPTQIVLTSDPTSVNENSGDTTINVSASFPGTITLTENVTVTVSILDGTRRFWRRV